MADDKIAKSYSFKFKNSELLHWIYGVSNRAATWGPPGLLFLMGPGPIGAQPDPANMGNGGPSVRMWPWARPGGVAVLVSNQNKINHNGC